MEDLCGYSVLKTRGVRLYFCTRIGADISSATYGEVGDNPVPNCPLHAPPRVHSVCLNWILRTNLISQFDQEFEFY